MLVVDHPKGYWLRSWRRDYIKAHVNIPAGKDLEKQCPDSCNGKHCDAPLALILDWGALWVTMASLTWKEGLVFNNIAILWQLNSSSWGVPCLRCRNAHTNAFSIATNISTDVDSAWEISSYATALTHLHATNIQIFRREIKVQHRLCIYYTTTWFVYVHQP